MLALQRSLRTVNQQRINIISRNLFGRKNDEKTKSNLPAIKNPFDTAQNKTKDSFITMVEIFENRDVHRRNHVEFIYAALKNMEEFGVHTDLEVYKALINVMPKGKFIPQNIFQAEFMHYPKQQQCIIDLLEQMEDNGVMPDYEMEAMLLNVFGKRGHPVRKYWRMMYWMPKFNNLTPWPVPNPPPSDIQELAKLAIERMCSIDIKSKIEILDTKDVKESIDKTWIVSGMSDEQSELLREHKRPNPIFIEGPFLIWLRNKSVHYFILRSDPDLKKLETYKERNIDETDDVSKLKNALFGTISAPKALAKQRSIHEQDDGTIFAICATGTSTKDSLLSWIRLLEKTNPCLIDIPILFKFKSVVPSNIVPIGPLPDKNIEEIKAV